MSQDSFKTGKEKSRVHCPCPELEVHNLTMKESKQENGERIETKSSNVPKLNSVQQQSIARTHRKRDKDARTCR